MPDNILFLVVDCLRADYVDINSKKAKNLTPFIEEFSKRGVCFGRAITQSSWTKTSVASMITGTYPFTHNVHKILYKLPDELPTIAEVYKNSGYTTGYFTSNPYLSVGTSYERGFEIRGIIDKDYGELLNAKIMDAIEANKNTPFFFYVQYMDAHQPYRVHSEKDRLTKEKVMKKYDTGLRSSGKVTISSEELSILKGLYAEEVNYTDGILKQLINHLEKIGLLEKTLVVITADHGIELFEHGGLYHSAKLYNELIRVPLIMVGSRIKEDRFIKGRVRSIDIMPTLLAYSNLKIPATVQGASLLDYINDRDINVLNLPAYSERDRTHQQLKLRTLIKDSWKIISYAKEGETLKKGLSTLMSFIKGREFTMIKGTMKAGKNYIKRKLRNLFQKGEKSADGNYFELFDLSKDPEEKEDLSSKNIAVKEEMIKKLNNFVEGKGRFYSKGEIDMDEKLEGRLKALGYMD